ncbi:unnamed protein product, partial [Laminaria digitata]
IAWPGGKIVSNKDEALASFLRRKLDQGQTLTPDQMAMLEKMVDSRLANNAPTAAAPRATGAGNRREKRRGGGGGGGSWRGDGYRQDSESGAATAAADARILLHKLEHKVTTASSPEDFPVDGVGNFHDFVPSSRRGRRKVDLSSLKRSQ